MKTFNRNPVPTLNVRPIGLRRPRIPPNGTAPRYHFGDGPLKGLSANLWTASTLPIVVGGTRGEYRRLHPNGNALSWHPI